MKVIGRRVLIEQTMTKKSASILQLDKNKGMNLDYSFKVLALGSECPKGENEVKVGDTPVFTSHVVFDGAKVVSEEGPKNDPTKKIVHTFVWYDDIVACE
jgi:hypothetical protein